MAQNVWPGAAVYTSLYRPESTFAGFIDVDVRTSFLDKLPVDKAFRALLPLYPMAFRSLGVLDADLVVSSSSAWAHGIRTAPHSLHVVYCYTPPRWLYMPERYFDSDAKSHLSRPIRGITKAWDQAAARRARHYIAISKFVRERIARVYGIDAEVVYPPVETDRFTPKPRGDRLLVVSRLLAYKRIDLAVRAANELGIGLDVVGVGPELNKLRAIAGRSVQFHGRLSDAETIELFESCSAMLLPGLEDFGITPVEANAAGKPVVAFGAGGALETLVDGTTAVFFDEQTVESMVDAIRRVGKLDTSPEVLARHATKFAPESFRVNLLDEVERLRQKEEVAA